MLFTKSAVLVVVACMLASVCSAMKKPTHITSVGPTNIESPHEVQSPSSSEHKSGTETKSDVPRRVSKPTTERAHVQSTVFVQLPKDKTSGAEAGLSEASEEFEEDREEDEEASALADKYVRVNSVIAAAQHSLESVERAIARKEEEFELVEEEAAEDAANDLEDEEILSKREQAEKVLAKRLERFTCSIKDYLKLLHGDNIRNVHKDVLNRQFKQILRDLTKKVKF